MSSSLYVGSCRHMYNYNWLYFPPRLHSTKEIIFFLENINNLSEVVNKYPPQLLNCIFGDYHHHGVHSSAHQFINRRPHISNVNKLIIEICSKKCYYYEDIPVNFYYASSGTTKETYNLRYVEISDEEIERDLIYILKLYI